MITPNSKPRRKGWLPRSYSNTWLTTLMVAFIVLISVSLSILFFWRSLYLPELKNHARYLTSELRLINSVNEDWQYRPDIRQWVYQHSHVVVVNNPSDFPEVADKAFVSFFTDVLHCPNCYRRELCHTEGQSFSPTESGYGQSGDRDLN